MVNFHFKVFRNIRRKNSSNNPKSKSSSLNISAIGNSFCFPDKNKIIIYLS